MFEQFVLKYKISALLVNVHQLRIRKMVCWYKQLKSEHRVSTALLAIQINDEQAEFLNCLLTEPLKLR